MKMQYTVVVILNSLTACVVTVTNANLVNYVDQKLLNNMYNNQS